MSRVLLVNDSKFESMIMKDMMDSIGCFVKITDEDSALMEVQSFRPDYVIVNYVMKKTLGDQLISVIKMQDPRVRCILFSSNPIKLEDFRFKKIDAVFQTPVDRSSLEKVFTNKRS